MAPGMLLTMHAPRVSPHGRGIQWLGQRISIPLLAGPPPAQRAGGWRSHDGSFHFCFLLPLKKWKRRWDLWCPRIKALCLRGIALAPSSVQHSLLGILLSVRG